MYYIVSEWGYMLLYITWCQNGDMFLCITWCQNGNTCYYVLHGIRMGIYVAMYSMHQKGLHVTMYYMVSEEDICYYVLHGVRMGIYVTMYYIVI